MTARTALLLALLATAGCAPQGTFPSVAPRAAEREFSTEEPTRTPIEVPSDAALGAHVTALRQQAAEGDRAFAAAEGPAAAAIGRAGAPQSERWVEAQLAFSRLEAARAQTMAALTALDQLAIGRADLPTNDEDVAAIDAAIVFAEEIAGRQQQRLEALRPRLSPP